jgi:hypothetical protein
VESHGRGAAWEEGVRHDSMIRDDNAYPTIRQVLPDIKTGTDDFSTREYVNEQEPLSRVC